MNGLINGIVGGIVNGRVDTIYSLLNLYPWMELPYFSIPDNGIVLLVGEEITIYGDSLVNTPIDNRLSVTYTCQIGSQSGNNFVINPATAGVYELRIVIRNGGIKFFDETININAVVEVPVGTAKLLMIGDSLMTGGATYFASKINSTLESASVTYLGTQGTTVKHEGRSGWSYGTFITTGSPFYKNGSLDVPAYFSDNSIDTPDFVYIRLGINDIFGNCVISGDGLTDSEMNAIINNAKTLIDGFLNYNAALKLVVAIPTIASNTVDGWNANYNESVYSQDKFIEIIHKLSKGLSDTFANGTYDARVDCSYEKIYLDRDDGYPKTAGIHTNGVHPDQSGYEQLGVGMALKFNEMIAEKVIPTVLAVTWTNDYAAISFTDNSGGVAEHEIYSSKNGAAYTLVTTLAAGTNTYNDTTWQNAELSYKVRAKVGTWFSDYSSVQSINTPLVFKTDQSTLVAVNLNIINIAAGKTVNVNWGDGSNENLTGNNTNKSHNYSSIANPYYIILSGDINYITSLSIYNQTAVNGDTTKWTLPYLLAYLQLGAASRFTGDWTGKVLPPYLTDINIASVTKFSGNMNDSVFPVGITRFYADNGDITGLPRGNYKTFDSVIGLYATNNNCNSAELDSLLSDINDYFASVTPIKNSLFRLNGAGGMGIPSATGLAAKAGIEAKYTAAGFTATILVNT